MAKMVQILGFRCERCGHEWVPRDKTQEPEGVPTLQITVLGSAATGRSKTDEKKKARPLRPGFPFKECFRRPFSSPHDCVQRPSCSPSAAHQAGLAR